MSSLTLSLSTFSTALTGRPLIVSSEMFEKPHLNFLIQYFTTNSECALSWYVLVNYLWISLSFFLLPLHVKKFDSRSHFKATLFDNSEEAILMQNVNVYNILHFDAHLFPNQKSQWFEFFSICYKQTNVRSFMNIFGY